MTVNRIAAGAAVCCAVMFASACGGGTAATGAPATSSTTGPSAGGAAGGTGTTGRGFPGATGLLAQIDGTTLQVQGTDAQVAVTYSPATAFTNTVSAHLSGIVVGACVQARSGRTPSGAGGSAPTSAPSAAGATSDPIKAASVEISTAVNGTCTALGGLRTPGAPGVPNPGRTRGSGAGGNGFAGNGSGAFGKVTAVHGSSFTVETSRPQNGSATTASPIARTVETSATTTFTQTKAASSKALVVGQCVTALGKADDTGSIAATAIALRPAQNGSCSTGFGGRAPSENPASPGGGSGA